MSKRERHLRDQLHDAREHVCRLGAQLAALRTANAELQVERDAADILLSESMLVIQELREGRRRA